MPGIILTICSFILGILVHKLWMAFHIDGVLEIEHPNAEYDRVHIRVDNDPTTKKYVVLEVKDNVTISQDEQVLL
jgi:hypothetical protein